MTACFAYSWYWQNEAMACVMGWLLALVRLGVANVRLACAAPRLATHRKQMPIAANVSSAYAVKKAIRIEL